MSRPRDLADLAFEHMIDVLENEDLSDSEAIEFFDQVQNLSEQEIAEIEDGMDSDEEDEDDDSDD